MDGEEVVYNHEELLQKHRQERKNLQSKIQSLKKSVSKGDKKKKKEVADEITRLEQDLDDKQNEELNKLKSLDDCPIENNEEIVDSIENNVDEEAPVLEPITTNTRLSRAQKRRNKKENEAKEREQRISEQSERNKGGPRALEMNAIKQVLKEVNLKLHNIPADGNCLYLAVNHQLEVQGMPTFSVNELRKKTAEFMRENKDDFLPFMFNELDESESVSEESFQNYCKDVANTKLWGSQLELKALSNILKSPIKIIQSNGPPTLQGENFKGPELTLTFHRHLYRLGEHYNSTLPAKDEDN